MNRFAIVAIILVAASKAVAAPAPIIGGSASTDPVDQSVVHLEIAGSPVGCTATAVASNVVITAAHCVQDITARDVTIDVGAAAPFSSTVVATDIWIARAYEDGPDDVALIRTASTLPVPAVALATSAPTVGEALHIVGFGETTAGSAQTVGTRHALAATIASLDTWFVVGGVAGATTCSGDSGGPWMSAASLATTPIIVALTSSGPDGCDGPAQAQRVDDPSLRIAEVIAAWSGPCAADNVCVTTGCGAFPDPDCGSGCGFDGTCKADCAVVDLDCPIGPGPGASCSSDLDCEDRHCVVAPDDASVRYCSRACTVNDAATTCPLEMPSCTNDSCAYDGRTPGSIGTACAAASDCLSGICDQGAGVCAIPCRNESCPTGYSCEPVGASRACTIPSGGCSSDSTSGNQLLATTLILLGLLALKKRG